MTLESGETLQHMLVVKLAFSAKQQKGLKDEYRIYGHLARRGGVQGVPTVHGVFRDPELDILAMVMSDAGRSLRDRQIEKGKDGWRVSEEERYVSTQSFLSSGLNSMSRHAFVEILQRLHNAGVRHNDIRPENLLISTEGQVSIIDLDRADFNVAESLLEQELRQLDEVLDGWY